MAYRKKMSKSYSKKKFAHTADKVQRKNLVGSGSMMRGGIRL